MRSLKIAGVTFRPGEVDWEDAYSQSCEPLPDFNVMRNGNGSFIGSKITSAGLVGRIGRYLIVITEKDEENTEFDYTLIPLRPKTVVRYHH